MAPLAYRHPPSVQSALPVNIEIPFTVPCYKRVFVAECHKRYSEFLRQGSLHTRYAVGFGRESEEGAKRVWLSYHLEKTVAGSPNS